MFAIDNNQKMCYTLAIKIKKVNKIENKKGNTMRNIPARYQKNRKNVCFALPIETIEELQKISQKYGLSFADVSRYVLTKYIEEKKNAH